MKKLSYSLAVAVIGTLLLAGCATPDNSEAKARKKAIKEREAIAKKWGHPSRIDKKAIKPFISVQPSDLFVEFGTAAEFTISAGPSGQVNYQWYFNDVPIPGATQSTYQIPVVTTNVLGFYQCMVSSNPTTGSDKVSLTAYSVSGNTMTIASFPPVLGANEPYYGCPFPAVGKLRFPMPNGSFVTKINGLSSSDYWVWDEMRSNTKITYQGLQYWWDWDCAENGFTWVDPYYSTNFVFMVYFPSSPPTNPYQPYYIEVSGFRR